MTIEHAPGTAESHGLEVVGYHDLGGNPAFKTAMQRVDGRYYLYLSHFWRSGWSVVDVTDPQAPVLLTTVDGPPNTWTLQVQVADELMLCALERDAGVGTPRGREIASGRLPMSHYCGQGCC